MRSGAPGRLENFCRLAQRVLLGEQPGGERCGRHKIRRELGRLNRENAGDITIAILERHRARGEQNRTLTAISRAVERALHALEQIKRGDPISGAGLVFKHRLGGPGYSGRALRRFFGKTPRGRSIIAPLRLDIKAAQAKLLGLGPRRQCAERALRRDAVAGKLRRLRAEQKRQRIVRRKPRALRSADNCAVRTSPEPIAIRPREMAR